MSRSPFIRKSTWTRRLGGVAAQAGNAAAAAATASLTSSFVHWGARAITSPVDGSKQSMYFVVFDSFQPAA